MLKLLVQKNNLVALKERTLIFMNWIVMSAW